MSLAAGSVPPPAPDGGGAAPALRDQLRVVVRRKWLVIASLVLVPATALAISLSQRPLYRSSAEVLLGQLDLAEGLTGIRDSAASQPDRVPVTQAGLARVPEVARRALDAVGLRTRTAAEFLRNSSVSTRANSDLLTFTVTDTDRVLATRLASAYAREYTAYRRELDTRAVEQARADIQRRMAALAKKGDSRGSLYASLAANNQKLRTMSALLASNAAVVREGGPAARVRPNPPRTLALGFGLALVLGIGLAYLVDAADTRVRDVDEIGERLGLPLLARLPAQQQRAADEPAIAMLANPAGVHAEGYRFLRANVDFVSAGGRARCIMVTSALEAEGKSVTAANLAVAYARAGRHVALVDLDFRRPRLHRLFGLSGRRGAADVAAEAIDLDKGLLSVPRALWAGDRSSRRAHWARLGSLALLPAGSARPSAGEFPGAEALGDVLAELRDRADLVLVDTPALLRVGDALALTAYVDALLVVVRLTAMRRPILEELRRVLDTCPVPKLGYVVTYAANDLGYGYAAAAAAPERAKLAGLRLPRLDSLPQRLRPSARQEAAGT
jgi:Mrp family chromosome partitioning ATPase